MYIAKTLLANSGLPTPNIANAIKECGKAFHWRHAINPEIKIKFWIYKCTGSQYKTETLVHILSVRFIDGEPYWNPNDLKHDNKLHTDPVHKGQRTELESSSVTH